MTHITTFRAYEWLRAIVEVGIALLIGSVVTAVYFAFEVVPAALAEQNVRARQDQARIFAEAAKQCSWVEVDDRPICRRKPK